jgi:hypothetical protein
MTNNKLYFCHNALLFMNEFNALNVQFLHKQFCLVIQWQLQKELGRNLTGYPL